MIDLSLFLNLSNLISDNRTIVSDGSNEVVRVLQEFFDDGRILEFNSGDNDCHWYIPQEWNLKNATLSTYPAAETLFTSLDSSMFVAPYSASADLVLKKEDLQKVIYFSEANPGALRYQHRLAYNPNSSLKDVSISIPKTLFDTLPNNLLYRLSIEIEAKPGTMKIFELTIDGQGKETVLLLSHYCHTGQWNDGLAGVLVMSMVASNLRKIGKKLNNSYRLLSFPETIGSSVYLHHNKNLVDDALFSIFSEMPGAYSDIRVTNTRRRDSYIDRVTQYILESLDITNSLVDFRKGWGNDELVFDSVFAGIPSISIDRAPFEHYHLSTDTLGESSLRNLDEVVQIITEVCRLVEEDYIPVPNFLVTPQLSKLGLYKDWTFERDSYDLMCALLDQLTSGKSVFDISYELAIPFNDALTFYNVLNNHGLVQKKRITTEYTRRG
jgi:aminopeptidase-like protein